MALAVASCVIAITACGSSLKTNSHAGSSGYPQALKFANCVRSHGLPNYPDPSVSGPAVIAPNSAINPQSPAYQSAYKACAKLQPGGNVQRPGPTESDKLAALRWAGCLRKHGMPNFPDPTTSSGEGLGYRGLLFPVGPGFDPHSPAFKQATAACGVGP